MAESRHIKQGNEQNPNQVGRSAARDTEDAVTGNRYEDKGKGAPTEMHLLKRLVTIGESSNVAAALRRRMAVMMPPLCRVPIRMNLRRVHPSAPRALTTSPIFTTSALVV